MRGRGRRKRHCNCAVVSFNGMCCWMTCRPAAASPGNAGHHHQVAGPRSRARQPAILLDPAGDLHRDDERTAHRVAADQRDVVLLGQLEQSRREACDPRLTRFRQRQRQRHPRGLRAHGGDVAEIHGERAIADRTRVDAARKVHALDDRVDRHDQPAAGDGFRARQRRRRRRAAHRRDDRGSRSSGR